jgi:hypothetical protein
MVERLPFEGGGAPLVVGVAERLRYVNPAHQTPLSQVHLHDDLAVTPPELRHHTFDFGRGSEFGTYVLRSRSHSNRGTTRRRSLISSRCSARHRLTASLWHSLHQELRPSRVRRFREDELLEGMRKAGDRWEAAR